VENRLFCLVLLILFFVQDATYASPLVALRAAARAATLSRSAMARSMSNAAGAARVAAKPQHKKIVYPFLVAGAAGLTALYMLDRPEDFTGTSTRSESRPIDLSDPSQCGTDGRQVFSWRESIEAYGFSRILRELLYASPRSASESPAELEKVEVIRREIPLFFNSRSLQQTSFDEFKEYFNSIENPEAPRSLSNLEWVKRETGLTEREILSVYMYTLDSEEMNMKMRRGSAVDSFPKTIGTSIDSALRKLSQKSPIPPETTLYRGTDIPKAVFEKMRTEGKFSDSAFLSTSTEGEVSAGFVKSGNPLSESVYFVIDRSRSGASITRLSSHEQSEVLFPAKTPFRVKSMTRDDAKGHWEIHLEEED